MKWIFLLLLLLASIAFADNKEYSGAASVAVGNFLVATPKLMDPRFSKSVVLIVQYDDDGTMGLIVNFPTKVTLDKAFKDMSELSGTSETLYLGGPVGTENMFVLLQTDHAPDKAVSIFKNVYLCPDPTAVANWASGKSHGTKLRVFAGYAGWDKSQLESEIMEGNWTVVQADPNSIFDTNPSNLWRRLSEQSALIQAALR
ncbi:MAG: hypothetical protein C5B54_07225 [Acidobacteria bacterium]|nr:MAG: hypothetical protein C5B54_07225 [Acidobacteriota bacterium]